MTTRFQPFCAITLLILGVLLIISSFFTPPVGIIDPSILVAFGQILTFLGALLGIDYHYRTPKS